MYVYMYVCIYVCMQSLSLNLAQFVHAGFSDNVWAKEISGGVRDALDDAQHLRVRERVRVVLLLVTTYIYAYIHTS